MACRPSATTGQWRRSLRFVKNNRMLEAADGLSRRFCRCKMQGLCFTSDWSTQTGTKKEKNKWLISNVNWSHCSVQWFFWLPSRSSRAASNRRRRRRQAQARARSRKFLRTCSSKATRPPPSSAPGGPVGCEFAIYGRAIGSTADPEGVLSPVVPDFLVRHRFSRSPLLAERSAADSFYLGFCKVILCNKRVQG